MGYYSKPGRLEKFVKQLKMPKITAVREKTLLDFRQDDYMRNLQPTANELRNAFTDHEVVLLIIWALISPSAGLAYLIWKKYQKLRWLAVPLLIVSMFQFIGQWGGILWLAERFMTGN